MSEKEKIQEENGLTRRDFIKTTAALSVASLAAVAQAQTAPGVGQKSFKVGLIGCGGRANGALENQLEAAKVLGITLEPYAFCDYFLEKAVKSAAKYNVPAERCFGGPDGYHKLLAQPIDIVIMATPPLFRPLHLEASIKAGKHVFCEKPVAVDPQGARRVIAVGKEAQAKGLCIVAGTQRRHSNNYLKNKFAIDKGAIGKILSGQVYWDGTVPWIRERQPGQSDADYMVNNWVNFTGMSGDHIVEQHIHNVDVANWFIGHHPVQAIACGGRSRRKTGDQYDFFAVDYDYGENCHIMSMCRQNAGCYQRVDEFFVGTEGSTYGGGKMTSAKLDAVQFPEFKNHDNMMVQEHIDLLNAIMQGKPNSEVEARNVAESTATVIMGRISAYTGQLVRWSDMMETENAPLYSFQVKPTAEDFETNNAGVVSPKDDVIAVPGSDAAARPRAAGKGKGQGKGQGKGKGKKKAV